MRIIWLNFDLIIIMAWESSEYYRITELGIIVLLGNIDFLIFHTRAVKINKLVSNFCAVSSFHMIINSHYSHPSSLF